MATALEVVSLDRAKLELGIPLAIADDDALLTGNIAAAVDFCTRTTGIVLADLAVADIPPLLTQASVIVVRLFYDGISNVRTNNSVFPMLWQLRVM